MSDSCVCCRGGWCNEQHLLLPEGCFIPSTSLLTWVRPWHRRGHFGAPEAHDLRHGEVLKLEYRVREVGLTGSANVKCGMILAEKCPRRLVTHAEGGTIDVTYRDPNLVTLNRIPVLATLHYRR